MDGISSATLNFIKMHVAPRIPERLVDLVPRFPTTVQSAGENMAELTVLAEEAGRLAGANVSAITEGERTFLLKLRIAVFHLSGDARNRHETQWTAYCEGLSQVLDVALSKPSVGAEPLVSTAPSVDAGDHWRMRLRRWLSGN